MRNKFYTLQISVIAALSIVQICQGQTHLMSGNNLRALLNANGSLFWDGRNATYEFPKGKGTNTLSAAALWIGGLDASNNLHVSAQTYRESGTDFWPGPLDANGGIDSATSYKFDAVWTVRKTEIDSFKAGLGIPSDIMNWPGGVDLAPFVDADGDKIYNPAKGDYPDIKGDEMAWFVYNDILASHTESHGLPMGIEIQVSAYTYNCGGDDALNNSLFFNYKIINKSKETYHDVYTGMWADFDIGNIFDDYTGSIPSLNTFYGYNGTSFDRDTDVSTKQGVYSYKGFGNMLPAQGVTYLKGITGDNGLEMPMSKFIYFNNDLKNTGNPTSARHYYNYLSGKWIDGTSLTFGGSGYGGTVPTGYAFPGDVMDNTSWTEYNSKNTPGDRRGIGSFGPFTLNPGDIKELTLVFSTALYPSGNRLKSVTELQKKVTDIIGRYRNNSLSACSGISLCSTGDSCIWPGDANHDGKSYMDDIFRIGVAYGSSGPKRPFGSSDWIAQRGNAWSQTFPDGVNYMHADCNGDGIIDSADVLPIVMNYAFSHPKTEEQLGSGPVISLNINGDTSKAGKTITGTISLGSGAIPADDVYGLVFSIEYDSSVIEPGSFELSLDNSSMGLSDELVALIRDVHSKGRTDIGIVRKNHSGVISKDVFMTWKYVVEGNLPSATKEMMNVDNVKVIANDLHEIPVVSQGDAIYLLPDATAGINTNGLTENSVKVYPDPATSTLNISAEGIESSSLKIIAIDGREILDIRKPMKNTQTIDVSSWPAGIYVLQLTSPHGIVVRKFVKKD